MVVNTGVVNTEPVNTTVFKGGIAVPGKYWVGYRCAGCSQCCCCAFAQTDVEPFTVISVAATATGLTLMVTATAFAAVFSHLLVPLTVT